MGIINQGILGAVSGKVGPVVGGKWKNIPYLRSYVVPKYSSSDDQKAQRSALTAVSNFARKMLTSIVQPLWNPKTSIMSGYNLFIKTNIAKFVTPDFFVTTDVLVAEGNLEGIGDLEATYAPADGTINITWSDNSGVNDALKSDKLYLVVCSKTGNVYAAGMLTGVGDIRETEQKTAFALPGGLAENIIVFAGFYRGTGSELVFSTSKAVACTTA